MDLPSKSSHTQSMLVFVVVFVCAVLVGSTALHVRWDKTQAAIQNAESTQTLATALNSQAESKIRIAETILTALATKHRLGGHGDAGARELSKIATAHLQKLGELDGLFMSDANGDYFLTTNATEKALNNRERAYFLYHQANRDPGIHIGQPVRSMTTGDWVITLSVGLYSQTNEFQGVALATLNVDRFAAFYRSLAIAGGGVVVLAKRDGTILARSQTDADTYLTNISESPLLKMANQGVTEGSVTLTSIVDGVRRIYGFDASEKYPVIVAVAMPEISALAAWKQRALTMWSFALIATLIVVTMGALVLRGMRRQSNMAAELHAAHLSLSTANKTLEALASEDGLTGLANRRHMDEWLDKLFRQSLTERMSFALLLIDVDYFKLYNDKYGHLLGDKALIEVGRAMKAHSRKCFDLAARYGGEEMALILSNLNAEQAFCVAEKVRASVEQLSIEHHQSPHRGLTVSIGVVAGTAGEDFSDVEQVVRAADQALYAAKRQGRNRVLLGSF
ncbi:sensor domain-containing diguanylate cyclase [Pseudomonas sp. PDM11]|uniref:sensor domain-containing diguanylate cyclase n=1 Tax=Pseudomonas sp. PDM11 TaxID=2769309 RepID=UPI001782292A|nr:sensor domain-containing diguanylate cyclase [Pseudomonas sp. PDM11]MBD9397939.1 diguanylate cyclase [Pseudomonas sp. PDM11]